MHLAHGCDIRPSLHTMGPRTDGGPPVIEYWVRPKGVAPDVLFALLCGDVSAPVTFGVERHRLGAHGPADGLSAGTAGRWLAAGAVHHGPDRPGLVRRGPHRGRLRGPHHRADPSAGDGARAVLTARRRRRTTPGVGSRPSCNAVAHVENRDNRRRKYGRGAAVGAATGGQTGRRTWWSPEKFGDRAKHLSDKYSVQVTSVADAADSAT